MDDYSIPKFNDVHPISSKEVEVRRNLDYSDLHEFRFNFDSNCCPDEVWEWLSLIHSQMIRLMDE